MRFITNTGFTEYEIELLKELKDEYIINIYFATDFEKKDIRMMVRIMAVVLELKNKLIIIRAVIKDGSMYFVEEQELIVEKVEDATIEEWLQKIRYRYKYSKIRYIMKQKINDFLSNICVEWEHFKLKDNVRLSDIDRVFLLYLTFSSGTILAINCTESMVETLDVYEPSEGNFMNEVKAKMGIGKNLTIRKLFGEWDPWEDLQEDDLILLKYGRTRTTL